MNKGEEKKNITHLHMKIKEIFLWKAKNNEQINDEINHFWEKNKNDIQQQASTIETINDSGNDN